MYSTGITCTIYKQQNRYKAESTISIMMCKSENCVSKNKNYIKFLEQNATTGFNHRFVISTV